MLKGIFRQAVFSILMATMLLVGCGSQQPALGAIGALKVSGIEAGNIIHRAADLAELKTLKGTPGRQAVYVEGRTSKGDGYEGTFYWLPGDQSTSPKVVADTQEGVFVKPDSPGDGSGGVWARQYSGPINAVWFGVAPGVEATTEMAALASFLANGDSLFFPGTGYIFHSVTFSGLSDVTVYADGATITQPVESTSGRIVTRKIFDFVNCSNVNVRGFKFIGQHTNDSTGSDNNYQSGVNFDNCINFRVIDCEGETLNRAFISSNGSSGGVFESCVARMTYQGFFVTASTDVVISKSTSYDAHYSPMAETDMDKSGGQGFLSDNSIRTTFIDCTDYRGGSEGFRIQHSSVEEVYGAVINCKSIEPRRYGITIRGVAGYTSIINSTIVAAGDPTIWDGSPYFFPYNEVVGILLNATGPHNSVENSKIFGGKASGEYGILKNVAGDSVSLLNNTVVVGIGYGIRFQSPYVMDRALVVGNEVQTGSQAEGFYAVSMGSGVSRARISKNTITGGSDGIMSHATDSIIASNIIAETGRDGVHIFGQRNIISENNIKNVGQNVVGAGIHIEGANNILGPNIVSDTQETSTLYRALWLASSAIGTSVGPVQEYITNTGVRRDVSLDSDAKPVYGKSAAASNSTATDVAGLVSDLNDLLSKLRSAGLMVSP